jgi:hypothetical protein
MDEGMAPTANAGSPNPFGAASKAKTGSSNPFGASVPVAKANPFGANSAAVSSCTSVSSDFFSRIGPLEAPRVATANPMLTKDLANQVTISYVLVGCEYICGIVANLDLVCFRFPFLCIFPVETVENFHSLIEAHLLVYIIPSAQKGQKKPLRIFLLPPDMDDMQAGSSSTK